MVEEGLPEAEARSCFFLIDRPGLLHDGLAGLQAVSAAVLAAKGACGKAGARAPERRSACSTWCETAPPDDLCSGCPGQPGTFTEQIIKAMAGYVERPIIFPLSNPTSRAEATPAVLIAWTDGRAVIATAARSTMSTFGGRRFAIAQCNNSYIFPGLDSGIRAVEARGVSDGMFMAAARCSRIARRRHDPAALLLPPLDDSRRVWRDCAGRAKKPSAVAWLIP